MTDYTCPTCKGPLRPSKKTPGYGLCDTCKKKIKLEEDYDDDYAPSKNKRKKKQGMNIFLLISLIIGVIYLIYSAVYWSGAAGSGTDTAEQIGAGLATVLVMPHLIMTVLAVIFNALGLFLRKRGFVLTGAILYTVAIVLFPAYFMFVIVEMILSYIGFAKTPKRRR